jgi:hypothetical protein
MNTISPAQYPPSPATKQPTKHPFFTGVFYTGQGGVFYTKPTKKIPPQSEEGYINAKNRDLRCNEENCL